MRAGSNQADSGENTGTYGFYFVAYIDMLGQRDEIARLTELPIDEASHAATLEILERTAGRVRLLRNAVARQATSLDDLARNALNEVALRRYQEIAPAFHQIGFSDSFVMSTRIGGTDAASIPRAVHGIYIALMRVAVLSLEGLAQGIPLRAGVEVERGINIYPNEVYGPALVNAYLLESKFAEYPRTLVGDGLLRFLDALDGTASGDAYVQLAKTLASDCRELICQSHDGRHMLHILSPSVLENLSRPESLVVRARNWVANELRRFRLERNDKLAERYSKLYRYFETNSQAT